MNKKVILAGGGTGGHIFPAIAIANALKKLRPDTEFLFVGALGKMEMEKVPQAGYPIKGLDIAGFNRSSIIKNIGLPFKLLKSFFQVRNIFSDFQPDAVVGVGGYSSFPVLKYAQQKGIPTFIHESNSFAGKANKMLGKKAVRIFVSTDSMARFFPEEKIMLTGNPIRETIAQSVITHEEGLAFFGLDSSLKTVLSVGGSLGAQSINEAIERNIDEFERHRLQLIWQTGKDYKQRADEVVLGKTNVWVSDFIYDMEYALAAADVVISRAGAMAIAELSVMKKPVVFVPFPFAAEDHQAVNAQTLVDKNAGLMIRDHEAQQKLIDTIIALATNDKRLAELSENIGKLAFIDADIRVAEEILKCIDELVTNR